MRYLLHDAFLKSSKEYSNNVAIYQENLGEFSYEQLRSLANQYANFFLSRKTSVREQPFVGILSPVHHQSIAAVLGTLFIGGTYVPLDEYSPDERLALILDNTQLDTLVIDSHWLSQHQALLSHPALKTIIVMDESFSQDGTRTFSLNAIKKSSSSELPLLNQVCDDLAYILHSSGSTGIPKGIMLTHRNARTFVDWMQTEFTLTSEDVVMSRAPFKFDLSVFDIFNTFNAGAKLVCFDWNADRPSEQKHADYVQLMANEKATIIYTTPSTFIVMMNRGNLASTELSLREVMYAGEPFPIPQLLKLKQALPNTRIANIYGPTETNIITYWWVDDLNQESADVPLGYVVEDTEILVVSEDGSHICEPDELGELWCRGGTVTLGYLGMEEKTAECLVKSPFHRYPAQYWRTGDFGFIDSAGLLHYRGRKDHMVKVKGFRIEIGEIESALAKNDALDEFCVVAVPDEKYGNRLYCYYSVLPQRDITSEELTSFLSTKLPDYMIPFKFFRKEVMPKTSSGKVDRVLLAEVFLTKSNNL